MTPPRIPYRDTWADGTPPSPYRLLDPRDADPLTVPPERVESDWEHARRARGCVWGAISGAVAVFWVGVALIVGEWLGWT